MPGKIIEATGGGEIVGNTVTYTKLASIIDGFEVTGSKTPSGTDESQPTPTKPPVSGTKSALTPAKIAGIVGAIALVGILGIAIARARKRKNPAEPVAWSDSEASGLGQQLDQFGQ